MYSFQKENVVVFGLEGDIFTVKLKLFLSGENAKVHSLCISVKVSDNPLTVKLKFEPAGRPVSESNYYLQEKENICVVCGKEDSFIRKNIVPREYRK